MTLTRAPALDTCTLARALAVFGAARGIIQASDAARAKAGMPPPAREFLSGAEAQLSRAERAWLENPRHCIVPFTDPRYPPCCVRRPATRLRSTSPATSTP